MAAVCWATGTGTSTCSIPGSPGLTYTRPADMTDSSQAKASARLDSVAYQFRPTMSTNGHAAPKVALITGGASGMGLSVAERLVERGWNVMIADINSAAGEKAAQRLGDHAAFVKVDTMDYESQAAAFVETWKAWSRLDFVCANAVCFAANFQCSMLMRAAGLRRPYQPLRTSGRARRWVAAKAG
jgi:hypothetical protein